MCYSGKHFPCHCRLQQRLGCNLQDYSGPANHKFVLIKMEGLEGIVKRVFEAQEARVLAYSGFESAYRLLSNGGSESAYITQTKDITSRFQVASSKINECVSDFQKVWPFLSFWNFQSFVFDIWVVSGRLCRFSTAC
jgi:hypothetical protein